MSLAIKMAQVRLAFQHPLVAKPTEKPISKPGHTGPGSPHGSMSRGAPKWYLQSNPQGKWHPQTALPSGSWHSVPGAAMATGAGSLRALRVPWDQMEPEPRPFLSLRSHTEQ